MVTYRHGGQVRVSTHGGELMGFGKPFSAGKSGNPGGRVAIAPILDGLGTTRSKVTAELIQFALDIMRSSSAKESHREYAHQWLTKYAAQIPAPAQTFDFGDAETKSSPEDDAAECRIIAREELAKMTPSERLQLIAEIGQASSTETVQ